MEKNELFCYQAQLLNQLGYAKISTIKISEYSSGFPAQVLFFFIQSLLISLANISKLFEGDSKNIAKNQRAEELRTIFNFKFKDFPIIGEKALRNTNEHFDERIDSLVKILKTEKRNYADCCIGTISSNGESAGFYNPNAIYMRHYDDKNRNILYVGKDIKKIYTINIDKLAKELMQLESLIQT